MEFMLLGLGRRGFDVQPGGGGSIHPLKILKLAMNHSWCMSLTRKAKKENLNLADKHESFQEA